MFVEFRADAVGTRLPIGGGAVLVVRTVGRGRGRDVLVERSVPAGRLVPAGREVGEERVGRVPVVDQGGVEAAEAGGVATAGPGDQGGVGGGLGVVGVPGGLLHGAGDGVVGVGGGRETGPAGSLATTHRNLEQRGKGIS